MFVFSQILTVKSQSEAKAKAKAKSYPQENGLLLIRLVGDPLLRLLIIICYDYILCVLLSLSSFVLSSLLLTLLLLLVVVVVCLLLCV